MVRKTTSAERTRRPIGESAGTTRPWHQSLVDSAVVLAIATGALYVLGRAYDSAYSQRMGLPGSFSDRTYADHVVTGFEQARFFLISLVLLLLIVGLVPKASVSELREGKAITLRWLLFAVMVAVVTMTMVALNLPGETIRISGFDTGITWANVVFAPLGIAALLLLFKAGEHRAHPVLKVLLGTTPSGTAMLVLCLVLILPSTAAISGWRDADDRIWRKADYLELNITLVDDPINTSHSYAFVAYSRGNYYALNWTDREGDDQTLFVFAEARIRAVRIVEHSV